MIDFNHHCKLGVKLSGNRQQEGEDMLKGLIERVRDLFEGQLKAMIEDEIKRQCFKHGIKYQSNPITKIDQLSRAWAEDHTMKETLWHCCFGAFEADWESVYEAMVLEKLQYQYLEDEQTQREGTDRRGNKGCVAKLARKVKRDVMKNINRRAHKTHRIILVAGHAPEIIGEYGDGKKKYKKRKGNDFNFCEAIHTKVRS